MLALKSKVYNPTFQSQVYMDRMFFYIIGNCISYYIKKPPAGCALRRTMMMSQATAAGARMCQGTFFVPLNKFFYIGYISEKRNNSSAYRIPHKVSVPEECPIARKFSVIVGTSAIKGAIGWLHLT